MADKLDKIAFIDIDGVIIPFGGNNALNHMSASDEAINSINILAEHGYRIILSSSWRHNKLKDAYALFRLYDIPLNDHIDPSEFSKSKGIIKWLESNTNNPKSIIIDDDVGTEFEGIPNSYFVRTDFRVGLTEKLVYDALSRNK